MTLSSKTLPISRSEQQILNSVDDRAVDMISRVKDWAEINSGSFHREGLARMRARIKDYLPVLEAEVSDIGLPEGSYIQPDGEEQPVTYEPSILVRKRPEAPVQLVMTGHYDTVFPQDSAFQSCTQLSEDVLGGPGVADMKGGIIVMLEALQALERTDLAGNVGYSILLSPDEEIGSPGSGPVLVDLGKKAHAGLTYEPSLPDGTLTAARKGSGNFTIVAHGKAAHAGREHHIGRNALAAISRLCSKMDALNGKRDGVTFNIGKIEGGGPVNIVPNLGIVRFNVRMGETEDMAWIERELNRLVQEMNDEDGIHGHLHGGFTRPPKPFAPANREVMRWVEEAGQAIGLTIGYQSSGGVCEGNNLWASGCPNVDTLGVVGGNIHSHEEYVNLPSFSERARLSTLILMKIASGEFDAPAARALAKGA